MVIVLFSTCLYFAMESLVYANNKSAEGQSDFSVYIDVDAKTWKTRGRIFYDVEGSIRRKLASAGFKIVRNEQDSHDLIII